MRCGRQDIGILKRIYKFRWPGPFTTSGDGDHPLAPEFKRASEGLKHFTDCATVADPANVTVLDAWLIIYSWDGKKTGVEPFAYALTAIDPRRNSAKRVVEALVKGTSIKAETDTATCTATEVEINNYDRDTCTTEAGLALNFRPLEGVAEQVVRSSEDLRHEEARLEVTLWSSPPETDFDRLARCVTSAGHHTVGMSFLWNAHRIAQLSDKPHYVEQTHVLLF